MDVTTAEEGGGFIRMPIERNGKWGYLDEEGEMVIEPQFAAALDFDVAKGVARASLEKGEWGFIGLNGLWRVKPRFCELGEFDSVTGLAVARLAEERRFRPGREEGLIDRNGKWTINPIWEKVRGYDSATGFAPARMSGHAWGLVDSSGAIHLPQVLPDVRLFPGSNRLFWAKKKVRFLSREPSGDRVLGSGEMWAVYHSAGPRDERWKLKPVFFDIMEFSCEGGLAWAALDASGREIAGVNADGAIVQFDPPVSNVPVFDPETGLATASTGWNEDDRRWGWIDAGGEWVLPPTYETLGNFDPESGLAVAGADRGRGWIDRSGEWVLPPAFGVLGLPLGRDGLAWAGKDGVWATIDRAGRAVKEHAVERILEPDEPHSRATVTSGGKEFVGTLRQDGEWVIPPRFGFLGRVLTERGPVYFGSRPGDGPFEVIDRFGEALDRVDYDDRFDGTKPMKVWAKTYGDRWVFWSVDIVEPEGENRVVARYIDTQTGRVIESGSARSA